MSALRATAALLGVLAVFCALPVCAYLADRGRVAVNCGMIPVAQYRHHDYRCHR